MKFCGEKVPKNFRALDSVELFCSLMKSTIQNMGNLMEYLDIHPAQSNDQAVGPESHQTCIHHDGISHAAH